MLSARPRMASSATLNRRVHSARGMPFGAASAAIAANTADWRPLQRGKRGVELGIVGSSDPHLDTYGVQVTGERGPEHVEQSRRTARTADGDRMRGPRSQLGLHATPDLVERCGDEIDPGREMMGDRTERGSGGLRDLPGRRGRIPVIGNRSDGRLDQTGTGLVAPRLLRPRSATANRSRSHQHTI